MQPSFRARELESDPRPLMIDSVVEAACRAGRAQVAVPHSLLSRPMHAAARRALPGRGPDWLSRRNDEAPHPPDGRPTRTPAAWLSLLRRPPKDVVFPGAWRGAPHQRRGVLAAIGQRHAQQPLMRVLSRPVTDAATAAHYLPVPDSWRRTPGSARHSRAVFASSALTVAVHLNQVTSRWWCKSRSPLAWVTTWRGPSCDGQRDHANGSHGRTQHTTALTRFSVVGDGPAVGAGRAQRPGAGRGLRARRRGRRQVPDAVAGRQILAVTATMAAGSPPTGGGPKSDGACRRPIALPANPGVGHPGLRTGQAARPLGPASEDGGLRRSPPATAPRGAAMTRLPTSTPPACHTGPPSTRRGPELLGLRTEGRSTVLTTAAMLLRPRTASTRLHRPSRTAGHDQLAPVRRIRTSLPG
jgi:hypothetical protein